MSGFFSRLTIVTGVFLLVIGAGAYGKEVPGPTTKVEEHNGTLTFTVDGKPFVTPVFETYAPSEKHFRQFAEAGCKMYGFPANVGAEPWEHSLPVWVGPDVWDFSSFDENVRMIVRADPDAMIFPRVYCGEPDWWRDAHPEACIRFSDGSLERKNPYRLWPEKKSRKYPSIVSTKWREDIAVSLRRLIDHIESSDYADRIFGYHVYGLSTEEWYHFYNGDSQLGDYSDSAKIGFRVWLKNKYWTVDRLREAWNDDKVDFETAAIPTAAERLAGAREKVFRDPSNVMNVIDWYQYYNEMVPDTIDYLAGIVKEATNRQKVVGAFYAYMFEFAANPESGHLAVGKLLESDNIDFIVVTASYGQRQLGSGGSILRSPHTSLKLHGKLWYEDNDNVSYLFPEVSMRIGDQEWERSKEVLAATDTAEETKWIYQRGVGFSLANGVHQSFFDLHGGYFDDPQIMADVADLYKVFERSANYDLSSAAEILVVADELSCMYPTKHSSLLAENLYDPPYRLIKCGAPYDAVYVDDLALLDMSPYKLVIVLNAYNITDEQQQLIEKKLKVAGKTVLWCYAAGLFNGGETNFDRMSEIMGIGMAKSWGSKMIVPRIELVKGAGHFVDEVGDDVIGPGGKSSNMYYVKDKDAVTLGVHPKTKKPVLAMKDIDGYKAIYSITASLPPHVYRAMAKEAGVHVYNDRNDTLYVNHSYLTVNADGAGVRKLSLLGPSNVYDAVTEELVAENVSSVELDLKNKETRVLRLEAVK